MSTENQTTEEVATPETEVETKTETPTFDPFAEQPPMEEKSNVVIENNITETVASAESSTESSTETKDDEEEIVDANEYLKQNLGFDDWDSAKAAIAELKDLKEKASTPAEIKFANEESKKIVEALQAGDTDPLYDYLDKKKTLAAVDKMDAAAAIKLQIKQSNPSFKSEDIQDVFEEKYDIPEKPEQKVDELDDEYESRVAKWNTKVEKITRRMERDAVTAKAELSKLNSELVLPDIPKKQEEAKAPEISPEELAKRKSYNDSYLSSVEKSVKDFSGFSTTVKDKDVEIPVSYNLSEDQRGEVKKALLDLAANNYDVNTLFAQTWVKKDGTIDTDRAAKDVARYLYGEQMDQKFANEAASQRIAKKLKDDKNISLKAQNNPQRTFAPATDKDEANKMAEFFFQQ